MAQESYLNVQKEVKCKMVDCSHGIGSFTHVTLDDRHLFIKPHTTGIVLWAQASSQRYAEVMGFYRPGALLLLLNTRTCDEVIF